MSKRKAETDAAPDFIASEEAQQIAVEQFIGAASEDVRANHALGLPWTDAHARQAKAREPRRAHIDEWIKKQLAVEPGLKSPELWARAPLSITDAISIDAFKKRVTGVRKKRR